MSAVIDNEVLKKKKNSTWTHHADEHGLSAASHWQMLCHNVHMWENLQWNVYMKKIQPAPQYY